MKIFSKLVKNGLRKKRISLRELARRVGLDASFFSKVLQGKRNPPGEDKIIVKIARCLDYDADTLVLCTGRVPKRFQNLKDAQRILAAVKTRNFNNSKKWKKR